MHKSRHIHPGGHLAGEISSQCPVDDFPWFPSLSNIANTNFHAEVQVQVFLENTFARDAHTIRKAIGKPHQVIQAANSPARQPARQIWRDIRMEQSYCYS